MARQGLKSADGRNGTLRKEKYNVPNVSTSKPQCEWSTANVQKSASVSLVVYKNIIVYVPQYPNTANVMYRRVHM